MRTGHAPAIARHLHLVAGVVLLSITGGSTADAVGLHGCPHHDSAPPQTAPASATATSPAGDAPVAVSHDHHAADHHAADHHAGSGRHDDAASASSAEHGHEDGPCVCLGECVDAPGSAGAVRSTAFERFRPTPATVTPPHPRIVTPRTVAFRILPLSTAPPTS